MRKELSTKQKDICEAEGKCVVRACPGSGKTFTVAAKMAYLLEKWPYDYNGIAVISFTNVAWEEIQIELNNSFSVNIPIKYPHFLGTIDSFINNFIFLPYGHLVLGCNGRPILAGDPVYPWKVKDNDWFHSQFFDKLSYDDERDFYKIKQTPFKLYERDGSKTEHYNHVKRMKKMFWKKGYVNQSDANYFAMKILESNRSIAKLIALRFPFIIIDEAQDTSKIQMKIIDYIVESGLKDIMLVGDPDQAIFEWNSANPDLFKEKANQWHCILMNENWRSSQKICNKTYFLTDLNVPSTSKNGDLVDYNYDPEIWGYDPKNVDFQEELINPFLEICEDNEIPFNSAKIAILARSRNLIDEIILSRNKNTEIESDINKNDIWLKNNYTRELAYSKYLHDKHEFQKSFNLLEKTYMSILQSSTIYSDYKLSDLIESIGYFNFKEKIFNLIQLMPKTDVSIGEWIEQFEENLSYDGSFPNIPLKISNDKYSDLNFDDLFSYNMINSEYPYNLSTIHKVKGETYEAVLLILKKKTSGPFYSTLLNEGKKTTDDEELRNVYVGITRPSKILVLAVPSEDKEAWELYLSEKPQESFKQSSLTDFMKVGNV